MSNLACFLWVAGFAIVGCIADTLIRKAGADGEVRWHWLILGQLCYISTTPGWFFVMRHMKFPVLGAVYSIFTVLVLTLIGIFVFKDTVTLKEGVGILLAVCSLVLLSRYT